MEIIRGLHNLRSKHRGSVVTIGNYDGVHLGHQAILKRLSLEAQRLELPLTVTIFEPTPRELFDPQGAPPRLSSLREKLEDLNNCKVDRVLCLPFNARLAALEAEDFVQQVLVDGLGAEVVAIGDDFRFGKGRCGDFDLLQKLGKEQGFEVVRLDTHQVNGARVSSSRVRDCLAIGDMKMVTQLLGRDYRISGRVSYGRQLGRTLGIPTANIALGRRKSRAPAPRFGVYAASVDGIEDKPLTGVANLGVRPTVDGEGCLLEVHLFDYAGDLYGKHLSVHLEDFIRDEAKFSSIDELKTAMEKDIQQAREFFAASVSVKD